MNFCHAVGNDASRTVGVGHTSGLWAGPWVQRGSGVARRRNGPDSAYMFRLATTGTGSLDRQASRGGSAGGASPEEGSPDSHQGGTLLDGHLEIVGHPHRQFGKAHTEIVGELIAQGTQAREAPSRSVEVT